MGALTTKPRTTIARPVAALVPLIQEELQAGNSAGLEHYRRAGDMLNEAREQVAHFKWGAWLSKNFHLSRKTAHAYMTLADRIKDDPAIVQRAGQSLRSVLYPDAKPAHAQWRPVFKAAAKVDVHAFAEVRQVRADEVQLHRDLALQLIDIGFKALATRLHPDRDGSKDAMRRLNRVRDELRAVATTRRFE